MVRVGVTESVPKAEHHDIFADSFVRTKFETQKSRGTDPHCLPPIVRPERLFFDATKVQFGFGNQQY